LRYRRQRAMALYVTVCLGVWLTFGLLVVTLEHFAIETARLDSRIMLLGALAVAAAWQMTPVKRRAPFQCRRTAAPVGVRADAGCVRFALRQGWRCVRSCWALMFVMAIVGHSAIAVMAALTALIAAEELTLVAGASSAHPRARSPWRRDLSRSVSS
ncbi:MAG TPA: DUF2182 domain-containing protein, partial [Ktedonobacterales bacterium]|nr:DUF2182 domain-containing protein [Ktedonobacterales bacterium]